jgi:ligand-binding SRPBCC domain-containing protein
VIFNPEKMSVHKLQSEQQLPITLERAWDFFSSPKNLSRITPVEMDFQILGPVELQKIVSGAKIEYSVKPLWGIPVIWHTLITDVSEPRRFTDKQLKGPYSVWEHTHTFIENEGGVLMVDYIKYALPLGFLGDIFHSLVVRKKIQSIFEFRRKTLEKLFN